MGINIHIANPFSYDQACLHYEIECGLRTLLSIIKNGVDVGLCMVKPVLQAVLLLSHCVVSVLYVYLPTSWYQDKSPARGTYNHHDINPTVLPHARNSF